MEQLRRLLPPLAAGGLVVAAVYAAGALGPAVSESTTTSSTIGASLVDEAISGPVLDWRQRATVGEGSPIAFGSFGDGYLLFAVDGEALVGWRSADLTTWEPLPMTGIPGASWWSTVIIDAAGIVAIGDDEGASKAWVSEDGGTWRPVALPEAGDSSTNISGALWHEGTLLLYGNRSTDPTAGLVARLPADWQAAVADGDVWPAYDFNTLTLIGPIDIPVYQTTFADLGVEEPLPNATNSAHIWISDDLARWESTTVLTDGYLTSVFETPDGGLAASAGEDGTFRLLLSSDGRKWEDTRPSTVRDWEAVTWHDQLVAWESPTVLRRSEDGIEWERESLPAGLVPRAPNVNDPWSIDRLSAGGLGLVGLTVSWDWAGGAANQPTGTVFEQNGYRLESSWDTGEIIVSDAAGEEVLSFFGWTQQVDPSVRYDPATRAVTIVHPTDGTPMLTVTTDQWQEASEAVWATQSEPSVASLLIFTTDGEAWSATTAPEWLRMDVTRGTHGPIVVEDDRVLAVATAADSGNIALWEGTLPG